MNSVWEYMVEPSILPTYYILCMTYMHESFPRQIDFGSRSAQRHCLLAPQVLPGPLVTPIFGASQYLEIFQSSLGDVQKSSKHLPSLALQKQPASENLKH